MIGDQEERDREKKQEAIQQIDHQQNLSSIRNLMVIAALGIAVTFGVSMGVRGANGGFQTFMVLLGLIIISIPVQMAFLYLTADMINLNMGTLQKAVLSLIAYLLFTISIELVLWAIFKVNPLELSFVARSGLIIFSNIIFFLLKFWLLAKLFDTEFIQTVFMLILITSVEAALVTIFHSNHLLPQGF